MRDMSAQPVAKFFLSTVVLYFLFNTIVCMRFYRRGRDGGRSARFKSIIYKKRPSLATDENVVKFVWIVDSSDKEA